MSRNDPEEMPSRKRRRVMDVPDGFEKRKQVAASKISAPKFSSGFDDGGSQPAQKPVSKSKLEVMPQFAGKPPSISKPVSHQKPASKTNLRHIPVPNIPFPADPAKKKEVPVFRVLPPPDLLPATKDDTIPSARLSLRPPPPPIPVLTPSKPIVPLKYLTAPTIPAPPEPTSDKFMRTISTTEIALATDLLTESGTAELAHIFLHDQHPEIAGHHKDESLQWNIGMSPQKGAKYIKGKGKEAKFVKGGLAARASELIARSRTSLALWHKETEHTLSSTSRRITPDLRLRIVEILDAPAGAKPSSPHKRNVSKVMSPGLALCRILSTPSPRHPHLTYLIPNTPRKQYHLVVLSFPTVAPVRSRVQNQVHARNPEDFTVGREIYVWEPWQEISLPSEVSPSSNDPSLSTDFNLDALTAAPFPLLPSTFPPRPSLSHLGEEEDVPVADIALLCSRFVIMS